VYATGRLALAEMRVQKQLMRFGGEQE
jgi:hypothetical protein